jgi:molecular chaperone GrpE
MKHLLRSGRKHAQLAEQLAAAQQLAEQRLVALQNLHQEFAAYRRRVEATSAESATAARCEQMALLLPVLDDLGRAFGAVPPEQVDSPWTRGVFLVAKRLGAVLNDVGVKRFGKVGAVFDPHFHEVLSTQVRPDLPEGTIVQIVLPGYSLAGCMVRPAQVIVSIPGPR